MDEAENFKNSLICTNHIVILLYNKFLKGCTVTLAYLLCILIVYDIICLTIDKKSRYYALSYIL